MNFKKQEALNLIAMFEDSDDDTEITVAEHEGVLKAWYTEYPEEGHIQLTPFCECSKPTVLQSGNDKKCDHCDRFLSDDDLAFQKLNGD